MEGKIPHMVEQVIKYSDGTETVINYRGEIIDGVLIEDAPAEVAAEEPVEVSEAVAEEETVESLEESA